MARLLDYLVADIISQIGGYYSARPCGWLKFTIGDVDRLLRLYPDCSTWLSGENPAQMAVVRADSRNPTSAAEAVVAHHLPFGMSVWLGLFISGVVIEIYVSYTHSEKQSTEPIVGALSNWLIAAAYTQGSRETLHGVIPEGARCWHEASW